MDDMVPPGNTSEYVAAQAEVKPPCFGMQEVDFRRFRECCSEGVFGDEEAVHCMREWVASGLCEQCQISILGRKSQQHFMSGAAR